MKRPGLAVAAVLVSALMTGCTDTGHAELQAFADETALKFRPVPIADPDSSRPASSGKPFAYAAGELRSPFQPPPVLKPLSAAGQPLAAPDFERAKGHLERFPLAQLRLVGNLSSRAAHVALVQDPNGVVHPLRIGDHMGTDFGRIRAVGDAGIELVEIIRDANGWVERTRIIAPVGEPTGEQENE